MAKPKHPLSRNQIIGLCKRFVKPEAYVFSRDVPLFYKVFEKYPDAPFWLAHELPFSLNCIAWFLSEDGAAHLTTAIALFHLDIPAEPQYHMNETKVGEDAQTARPKTTVADLFR